MGFINFDEMASVDCPLGEIIYWHHWRMKVRVARSGCTKSETLLFLHELSTSIPNPFPNSSTPLNIFWSDKISKMYFSTALLLPLAALAVARPQEAAPAAAGSKKNVYLASCTSRSLLDSKQLASGCTKQLLI
jgi:hypothetical protein